MSNLYLRIWFTVVAVLLLFALAAGWLFQSTAEQERERVQSMWAERASAWAALIENSLPEAYAPESEQRDALLEWSNRLRLPLALDHASGRRIATSAAFARREAEQGNAPRRTVRLTLSDGRALWIMRQGPGAWRSAAQRGERGAAGALPANLPQALAWLPGGGLGLVATLAVLFLAIALGAYPVVRRLTRRLEALQRGVESFGAGKLSQRVDASGNDEVAALATSFNAAARRIETLLDSHRTLLANASHELRSPLARMKMALSMLDSAEPPARERLQHEIEHNIGELDALVEEILLASRLDASQSGQFSTVHERVALLPLAAEEAARVQAGAAGDDVTVLGDERLLRRAVRNLLENARRYGGTEPPEVDVRRQGAEVQLRVNDRGPGVPPVERERIFEPFYRMPGHAEQAGGVGLGLSLVRRIATAHRGRVHCEAREGGGSSFVLSLPA